MAPTKINAFYCQLYIDMQREKQKTRIPLTFNAASDLRPSASNLYFPASLSWQSWMISLWWAPSLTIVIPSLDSNWCERKNAFIFLKCMIYPLPVKVKICFMFWNSLWSSLGLNLFEHINSKNSDIVKYYYNLKLLNIVNMWWQSWISSSHYSRLLLKIQFCHHMNNRILKYIAIDYIIYTTFGWQIWII